MTVMDETKNSIIEAMMTATAAKGWANISMADIAEAAQVDYGELCLAFESKRSILRAFAKKIDNALITEVSIDADEPARDRLFEVMMERFELLRPYRKALAAIAHDLRERWAELPDFWGLSTDNMDAVLSLAEISLSPLVKPVKIQALVAINLRVMRTFLKDDSDDLSATMKALDEEMGSAERWANSLNQLVEPIGNPDAFFNNVDRMFRKAAAGGRKFRWRSKPASPTDTPDGPIIDAEVGTAD